MINLFKENQEELYFNIAAIVMTELSLCKFRNEYNVGNQFDIVAEAQQSQQIGAQN